MKQILFISLFPLLVKSGLNLNSTFSIYQPNIVTSAPITKNLVAKKWYLTKTSVNQISENQEENNTQDYFHFLPKGSCIFYESTFETKEIGKWTVQNNRLIVKVESETRTFIIKEINAHTMHLQVSTDDPIIDMYFNR